MEVLTAVLASVVTLTTALFGYLKVRDQLHFKSIEAEVGFWRQRVLELEGKVEQLEKRLDKVRKEKDQLLLKLHNHHTHEA